MSLIPQTEILISDNSKRMEKNKKRKKLEDFWIEYKNQDIFEALEVFSDSPKENKKNQLEHHKSQQETDKNHQEDNEIQENLRKIPDRLIEALTDDGYLINKKRWEKLHQEITYIKSLDIDKNLKNEKIQSIIEQLPSEELLWLFFYAYVYSFRKTQIIDKNDIENLRIPKLYKLMPEKPKDLPPKPKKEDFHSKYEYLKEIYKWNKDKVKREIAYKKRLNRSPERKRKEDAKKYLKKYLTDLFYEKSQNKYSSKVKATAAAPILSEWIPSFLEHKYYPDILQMSQDEELALENMLKDLKKGENFVIMVNHDTFANIPAVIIKIMQKAKELWINDINEFIYTAIWDLIMCNIQQEALMNTVSNICPTSPTTNRIKWGNPIARQRRKNFTNYLEKILLSWNKTGNKGWWHLVIMAPSGTRDVIHRTESGKPYIFIPDETQPSNKITLWFARDLAKQWVKIMAISTNTSEIKKPNPDRWVTANNHEMNPWAKVTIHLNKLYKEKADEAETNNNEKWFDITEMDNWEIVNVLANRISYANPKNWYEEEPCGIKVPIEIFLYIKSLTKNPEYSETWRLPRELFIDEEKWELNSELIREKIKEMQQNKAA